MPLFDIFRANVRQRFSYCFELSTTLNYFGRSSRLSMAFFALKKVWLVGTNFIDHQLDVIGVVE